MKKSEEAKDYDVKKTKEERDNLVAHYEALFKQKQQVPILITCLLVAVFMYMTFKVHVVLFRKKT
jgi:hypothetical protein